MKVGMFNPKDSKYWSSEPEEGFSVKRNKAVIASVIKKHDKMRAKKMAEFNEGMGERSEAVASLLTSRMANSAEITDSRIDKYFGKKFLAHLQGKDGVERVKNRLGTVFGNSPMPEIISKTGKIKGKKISDVRSKKEEC